MSGLFSSCATPEITSLRALNRAVAPVTAAAFASAMRSALKRAATFGSEGAVVAGAGGEWCAGRGFGASITGGIADGVSTEVTAAVVVSAGAGADSDAGRDPGSATACTERRGPRARAMRSMPMPSWALNGAPEEYTTSAPATSVPAYSGTWILEVIPKPGRRPSGECSAGSAARFVVSSGWPVASTPACATSSGDQTEPRSMPAIAVG